MRPKPLLDLGLLLACLIAIAGCENSHPSVSRLSTASGKSNTYVIVHGAWGGGWDWKHVANLLATDGNPVYRPTLSGQARLHHSILGHEQHATIA